MATADQSEGQKISDTAVRYGLPRYVGWQLAFNLLPGWTATDLENVFDQVDGIDNGFDNLRTVHRDQTWTKLNVKGWQWIKTPWDLMQQAAKEKKALCVNRRGEFALLQGGFFAISHAGIEGLYEDGNNRGLPRSVVDEVFSLTDSLKPEWLWIDSLSIPAGRRDLNVAEEELKNRVINMMAQVYGRATAVIVLDALVMHLISDDPLDIAVALLCGRRSRRMWTYQEGRLAKSITILTRTGSVSMRQLSDSIEQANHAKDVSEITRVLETMMRGQSRPRLNDIASTFFSRQAGLFIDFARALYPILNLTWDERFGRDRAMAVIYERYRQEAAKLVCSFGPPRLVDGPGWAPSTISGLTMHTITDARWTNTGLLSTWYVYKLRSVGRHETNKLSLQLEFDEADSKDSCWAFTTNDERETTRKAFADRVVAGQGVLLTHKPLEPMKYSKFLGLYRIVLLAAGTPQAGDAMFQVYLTAQIFWLDQVGSGDKQLLTLSHESPFYKQSANQKSENIVIQALTTEFDPVPPVGTPLHQAVQRSDLNSVIGLLKSQANSSLDINTRDALGWTPLHWAVTTPGKNSYQVVEKLIEHGAILESDTGGIKSPLILSLELASNKIVLLLLQRGALIKKSNDVTPLAQAVWARRSRSILEALLFHGANVNEAVYGYSPLWLAQTYDLSEFLVEHGADPNARTPSGETRLHRAAYRDDVDTINLLFKHGAAIDVLEKDTGCTPLFYAIDQQNIAAVKALLDLQANANFRTKEGWPLLVGAAGGVSIEIVQALLSAGAKADVSTAAELWTPLHTAVKEGRFANLNLLLEQADSKFTVWRKDKDGMNARDLALKLALEAIAKLLERRMKQEDSKSTKSTEGSQLVIKGWFVIALFGLLQYSSCARARFDGERIWSYWSQILFSTDLLALKVAFGVIVLGVLMLQREQTTHGQMSVENTFSRSWKNKSDASSSTVLGVGLMAAYVFGVWYYGSPLNSYIGVAILLSVPILVATLGANQSLDTKPRDGLYYLCGFIWVVAALPLALNVIGLEAIIAPLLSAFPSYMGVLAIADDGTRSKEAQEALSSSKRGWTIGITMWIAISLATVMLGWELLAIIALLMSVVYFGVMLIQALTQRDVQIDSLGIGLRGYFFGSLALSGVLAFVNAEASLNIVCVLCLVITARDAKIILTNYALRRGRRERKGRELKFEVCLISSCLARLVYVLSRRFAISIYLPSLLLFTAGSILVWSRKTSERAPKGTKLAPYLLLVGIAWSIGAVATGCIEVQSAKFASFAFVQVAVFGLLTWLRVGEHPKKD